VRETSAKKMSWRPGRSGSFRRSGIHLDGSSFRLSSSRNQSDDDSSDTKPASSTTRSFLRMRPSSGNSSDGGAGSSSNGSAAQSSTDALPSLPLSRGSSFRSSRDSSGSSTLERLTCGRRSALPSPSPASPLQKPFGESEEKSLTLPWNYNSSGSYRPFGASASSSTLSSTTTTTSGGSANEHDRRSNSLQRGFGSGQTSLRPPSYAGSEDEGTGNTNTSSRTPSLPWNSLSSRLSSATLPSKRKLQKVEVLHLTEPSRELVSPDSVTVSGGESVYLAQPVVTPIERLRRKDREVATALEEKQRLIEEILQLPHQEVDSAIAGFEPGSQPPRSAAEILLATLAQARALTVLVNKSLKVSEEEAVRALASRRRGGVAADVEESQARILAKGERLVEITSAINKQLTLLLTIVQENEKERENLRRELCRSQEQVRSLLSGDSSSWSSPLSPTSASTPLSPVSGTPASISPMPSPLTSKSSSPPFPTESSGERSTVFSSLSSLSR